MRLAQSGLYALIRTGFTQFGRFRPEATGMIGRTSKHFRSVFEHIRDALLVVDENGAIHGANRAASELLDLSSGRLDGVASLSKRFVFDGESVQGLVQRTEPVLGHPLEDGAGNVGDVALDILELAEANGKTKLKLVHVKDYSTLKERDRWKDDLVSTVAHEVKNPLFAMKNSMNILMSQAPGPVNPEQNRLLSTSMRSIDRLTRLLDGLLEVSRVGSGDFLVEREWIAVREFMPDVIGSFESLFNVQQKTLVCNISDETDEIHVDALKLEQILINLLSNAFKYTPMGGQIEVTVGPASLEALSDDFRILPWRDICDPRFVSFAVRDNGIGMTGYTLSHLFTRYFNQARQAGHEPGRELLKGSHLGLSISKTLAEVQNGTLAVESEAGVGTEVTAYLPKDPETAEIVGRFKSIERCFFAHLRKGVFVYALRKYESKQWAEIVEPWPTRPVVNPCGSAAEESTVLLWTLGDDVAVAVAAGDDDPGLIGDGSGDGNSDTSVEGYMVGRSFAPVEGSRITQLLNLAFNRMRNASPVLSR